MEEGGKSFRLVLPSGDMHGSLAGAHFVLACEGEDTRSMLLFVGKDKYK